MSNQFASLYSQWTLHTADLAPAPQEPDTSGADPEPFPGMPAMPPQRTALRVLWRQLLDGDAKVRGHVLTRTRCYLVLRNPTEQERRSRLHERHHLTLQRFFEGQQQKALAIELGLTQAGITSRLNHCMGHLGLDCRAAAMPLMVVMAGIAYYDDLDFAAWSNPTHEGQPWRILSVPRPDLMLPSKLSQAEADVFRLILEGRTHREMAQLRSTSPQTIANQVSAVFRKLGQSGRVDLVRRVWRDSADAPRRET